VIPKLTRLRASSRSARASGLTAAIREAAWNELERVESKLSRWERAADIRAEIASWPKTGLKADKAFFDSLSDEDD
jgi:antitoxin VapB